MTVRREYGREMGTDIEGRVVGVEHMARREVGRRIMRHTDRIEGETGRE